MEKEDFKKFILSVPSVEQGFIPVLFDCDAYAKVFSGRVKEAAAKKYSAGAALAFGDITVRHKKSGEVHTLNFFITEDEDAFYYEPQGSIFVNGENYKPIRAGI